MEPTLQREMIFAVLNGKVSTAISRKLYRSFRKNGIEITPEQWTVLRYLWDKDNVMQQELCNTTFKDKPSMTRLIDNLEKQLLVTRLPDPSDRRINIIRLTERGRNLEEKAGITVSETMKEALEGLSESEIKTAGTLLNRVFLNIKNSLDE